MKYMPNLEEIDISGTQVEDITSLESLSKLQRIYAYDIKNQEMNKLFAD